MHPPHARRITTTALALAIALTACSFNNGYVTTVTIDGGDRTIVLGDPLTLTTTLVFGNGATNRITWTSSEPSIASIDATGNLTTATQGTTQITATSTSDPSKNDTITLTINPPGALRWTRQFGTSGDDDARGVATDANGNIYVAGYTIGDLEGTNIGGADAFLRAYDANGELRWTRQFGTSTFDGARGVAIDADGTIYVAGTTSGDLEGTNTGDFDAFLRAYDSNGTPLWTRQFGTSGDDEARGVATDANGNVYVTGDTYGALEGTNAGFYDAFLRAYDSSGEIRWTRQFGSSGVDQAGGVAIDADGNIYVAGYTTGDLEGTNTGFDDAFLRAYDPNGEILWTRQFGTTTYDYAFGVATDANRHVYVTGYTTGDLEGTNTGDFDAFLRAYDRNGEIRWTRQFGTSDFDAASGVATDANGNVYATGTTTGALEGTTAGFDDVFLRAYDPTGELRWTRQFGTTTRDYANGVATDANGHVYATGRTAGALEGTNAGDYDAFLRAYGR